MALESLTGGSVYINALVTTNPTSSDSRSQGDDHIRGIKNVIKNTFPNISGAMTSTHTELNLLDGMFKLKGLSTKTTTYTVATTDENTVVECNATAGAFTVTLLAAATAGAGFRVSIKKTDSSTNDITVDGNASETIDGAATFTLGYQYHCVTLISDGTNWYVEAESPPLVTQAIAEAGTSTERHVWTPQRVKQAIDALAGAATFPATTRMLFQQTAAPTGWTKVTTAAYNDTALRVVTGTVTNNHAGTAFTSVFGSSKTTGAHTLTTTEMPAHAHGGFTAKGSGTGSAYQGGSHLSNEVTTTDSQGGGGSHTHTLSLDLEYTDIIVATKD